MSPAQEEVIATAPEEQGAGELLDVSAFELELAESESAEEPAEAPTALPSEDQGVELVQGSLRGRDPAALVRQGELLAHDPGGMVAYLSSVELHPGRERFLG
ncbi:MAG: hypothetical protein MK291_11220, partial [Planctomycetes bacterium]|nr:hypothetical protein [Planctomycetota bacterium]